MENESYVALAWAIRAISVPISCGDKTRSTGSIVLLVGSSAFHGQGGRLPWFFASPLLLLSASVLFGLLFMAWMILNYED
jgi:hypothetical protein